MRQREKKRDKFVKELWAWTAIEQSIISAAKMLRLHYLSAIFRGLEDIVSVHCVAHIKVHYFEMRDWARLSTFLCHHFPDKTRHFLVKIMRKIKATSRSGGNTLISKRLGAFVALKNSQSISPGAPNPQIIIISCWFALG